MSDAQIPQGTEPQQGQPVYQQPQYQQPVYQQPGYGQQPGVNYVPGPPRGLSVTSMVIGIVTFLFPLFIVPSVVGLILGVAGLKKEPAGRGFAIAGIWLNAIILALVAIGIVFVVITFLTLGAFTIPFLVSDYGYSS